MADTTRDRANARLDAALDGADQADPRPFYRPALKFLKGRDEAAFRRATRYFTETLEPAVAGEADPLDAWTAYGRVLAGELGEGRLMELDSTGRARATSSPESARGLVLFIPDAPDVPVLVVRYPKRASDAQRATCELLVRGRQTASRYEE